MLVVVEEEWKTNPGTGGAGGLVEVELEDQVVQVQQVMQEQLILVVVEVVVDITWSKVQVALAAQESLL
jgi:hypothetical protein